MPALLVDSREGEGGKDKEGNGEKKDEDGTAVKSKSSRPWRWRTDLAATQPFWEDWFVGLSKKFLEAKGGKLLLLAGTDRLDTELTIGQMQGESFLFVFFAFCESHSLTFIFVFPFSSPTVLPCAEHARCVNPIK